MAVMTPRSVSEIWFSLLMSKCTQCDVNFWYVNSATEDVLHLSRGRLGKSAQRPKFYSSFAHNGSSSKIVI